MKILTKTLHTTDVRSFSDPIDVVLQRLDERKRTIAQLTVSLRQGVLDSLISPRGLAIAGGAGYLLAEWMHRPPQARPSRRQRTHTARRSALISLKSSGVLLLRLALQLGSRRLQQVRGSFPVAVDRQPH